MPRPKGNFKYYLFKKNENKINDVTGELEEVTYQQIGAPFLCDEFETTKGSMDIAGGFMRTTTTMLKTRNQLEFKKGDLVSTLRTFDPNTTSAINNVKRQPQNSGRGGRLGNDKYTYILEIG